MFRRISGSSSMTSIFFMVRAKNGKPYDHRSPFADFTFHLDLPAVQFSAAFYQQQAKPGAGTSSHIAAPMEGLEQLLLIDVGDADPLIANDAYGFSSVAFHCKMYLCSRFRILHSVAQEIREDVPEQPFVRFRFKWNGVQRQFDNALAAGRGKCIDAPSRSQPAEPTRTF